MSVRLFTQSELNTLCQPGEARFLAALESGDKAHAKGGTCRIRLHKDPQRAAPEHYAMVGMQQP